MNDKLRQYVRRIMQENGFTVMGVSEASGGQLTTELLDDIRQGEVESLSEDEVKALARGLGQSEDTVRAVVESAG